MSTIRLIRQDDRERLFRWRNREDIIELSSTGKGVTEVEHNRWFDGVMLRLGQKSLAYIIEEVLPIGHLRFDRVGKGQCEISIYIANPAYRKCGSGSVAFTKGIVELKQHWPDIRHVTAFVKIENSGAQRFFRSLGFSHEDTFDGIEQWNLKI